MIGREDLEEVEELEAEIKEFIGKMVESKDKQEFEMYRQMILVNVAMIKVLLNGRKR